MMDLLHTFLVRVQYEITDYDAPRKTVDTMHLVNVEDAAAAYDKVGEFYKDKQDRAGMYTTYWVNSIEVM